MVPTIAGASERRCETTRFRPESASWRAGTNAFAEEPERAEEFGLCGNRRRDGDNRRPSQNFPCPVHRPLAASESIRLQHPSLSRVVPTGGQISGDITLPRANIDKRKIEPRGSVPRIMGQRRSCAAPRQAGASSADERRAVMAHWRPVHAPEPAASDLGALSASLHPVERGKHATPPCAAPGQGAPPPPQFPRRR